MNQADLAKTLNRFSKTGDLHDRYHRRIASFDSRQKRRLAENILAGDEIDMAIRDARRIKDDAFETIYNSNLDSEDTQELLREAGATETEYRDWRSTVHPVEKF